MGNCLTCFKELTPTPSESDTALPKEDMPQACANTLPSRTSSQPEVVPLGNGNRRAVLTAAEPSLLPHHHLHQPIAVPVGRFYSYQRRTQGKSAASMGANGSTQPCDAKIEALFETYRDEHEDAILAEGIERLCRDLQVSPDEFKVLVLAWKLDAEQMCRFTRKEFVTGLRALRADSVRSIQSRLPELVIQVQNDSELFKDLYKFAFRFGLDASSGQRILPSDMAVPLWRLVFTVREPPILARWLNFLEKHPLIRGIPRDTWNMFLNFSETVGADLSSYDDNEAWPSLFDDFVEYENDRTNQNVKDKEHERFIMSYDV